MRLCIWTNIPNHYQAALYSALRSRGEDLRVCYYERVHAERIAMGWNECSELPHGESYVEDKAEFLRYVPDYAERVHVVPGYASKFSRRLAIELSQRGAQWVHWSEPSHPGIRWWLSLPRKRWYARLVNEYALGAFGIGVNAMIDFAEWGIRTERLAMLPYSAPVGDCTAVPDRQCQEFAAGRLTFVYLGALCRRKATDVLLRAFAGVVGKGADARLLLVGNDKSGGEYARLAKSLGISDCVLFRGPMPPNALSGALRCSQVLVLPSRYDGWGVVVNEGASMGLALIGSAAAGASWHLIESGESGFRVEAGSVTSLMHAMEAYVQCPSLAESHGVRSLALYAQWSPSRNADRFVHAIEAWRAMKQDK